MIFAPYLGEEGHDDDLQSYGEYEWHFLPFVIEKVRIIQ